MRKILAVVLFAFVLSACSSGPVNMDGSWSLTATNTANDNYTTVWVMNFNQSGNGLSGSGYFDGYYVGSISGSVSGNRFSFRLNVSSTYGGGYADFTGNSNGSTFTGSYTASGGGYGPISGNRLSSANLSEQVETELHAHDISAFLQQNN